MSATAVLLPVKAFRQAKLRLAPALDGPERAALAREMATKVVRAAHALPVAIVCDDDEVAAWAVTVGASVIWRPGRGLSAPSTRSFYSTRSTASSRQRSNAAARRAHIHI